MVVFLQDFRRWERVLHGFGDNENVCFWYCGYMISLWDYIQFIYDHPPLKSLGGEELGEPHQPVTLIN